MIIAVSYDIYSDILCIFVAYFFSGEGICLWFGDHFIIRNSKSLV